MPGLAWIKLIIEMRDENLELKKALRDLHDAQDDNPKTSTYESRQARWQAKEMFKKYGF